MKKNRKDAKLIKQDNGIFNLIYYLKPKRAYAEVYINKKFDVTNLVKYMEKLKKEDYYKNYKEKKVIEMAILSTNCMPELCITIEE